MPLTTIFTNNTKLVSGTTATSNIWDFGDGTNVLNNNTTIPHLYQVGEYDIKLIVTDNQGCKDSLIRYRYIKARKPVASFNVVEDTVCVHRAVQFLDMSTGATGLFYKWYFGDGDSSSVKNPGHIYNTTGSYPVRLIVTDSTGCRDTFDYSQPIVITCPHAAFTQSVSVVVCPPLVDSFISQSTGASLTYNWTFDIPSGPVTVPNPVKTFTNPGKYIVTLTVTDMNGCSDTASDSVRVLGYNGSFTYTPTDICVGGTVFFNANVPNIPEYKWDFADGTTITTNTPTISHVYTTPNTYWPTLIYSTGPSCSSPLSTGLTPVRVDKVTANFTWSVPCVGVPFTLTDNSNAQYVPPNTWNWNFGAGATATGSPTTFT
jgi:PKD repeat protein